MEDCYFCEEGRLNVGDKTKYGARIILKIGDFQDGWFATLSPKTGGDLEKDFSIQLMPFKHLKFFSEIEQNKKLSKNYGIAFAKLNYAVGEIIKSDENGKIPIGIYGKCKHPDEHIHLKIFPYRGDIGQPFTVDSSFGKKEIFNDGEDYIKMKPVEKRPLEACCFEELSNNLIKIINRKKIDLHLHTTASDGELSPEGLVGYALKNDMKAIAITDHDTVSGIERAIEYAKEKGIEIVPGIEISTDDFEKEFYDVHVLGLFIDYKNKELNELTEWLMGARIRQKKEIIKKLNELGYEISFEELEREVGEIYGRPHIAKILMKKYPSEFPDMRSVFDELLGTNKKAYVLQEKPSLKRAMEIIRDAGGVAILAHPGVFIDDFEKVIERFVELGGQGLEVYYPYSDVCSQDKEVEEKLVKKIEEIALKNNLLITGGSDYHGKNRPVNIGDGGIEVEDFERLKNFMNTHG